MTAHFLEPVPPSLRRPDKPDRLMSGFRLAVRGYAAVASRARIIEPALWTGACTSSWQTAASRPTG